MTSFTRKCRRLAGGIAVLAVGAILATGCSGGSSDPTPSASGESDDLDALIDAAQAEGTLTWYTGTSPAGADTVAQAFAEEYGVQVNIVRLTSNEIAQRFQAEAAAENIQADVLLTVAETFFTDMRDQGLTEELDPADFDDYPDDLVLGDGAGLTTGINVPVIVYNSDVLGDFEPETWEDLLDPALDGQIVIADPRASSAWAQYWSVILEDKQLGEAFIEDIAAQNFTLTASTVPGIQLVGAGEGGLLIAGTLASAQPSIEQGLPLKTFTPKQPTITGRNWATLVADSPHPNAGRLFLHWLVSDEGSKIYNSAETSASPRGNVGGDVLTLPADAVPPPSAEQVAKDLPQVGELLGLQ